MPARRSERQRYSPLRHAFWAARRDAVKVAPPRSTHASREIRFCPVSRVPPAGFARSRSCAPPSEPATFRACGRARPRASPMHVPNAGIARMCAEILLLDTARRGRYGRQTDGSERGSGVIVNLDALLEDATEAPPCGPNLEHDLLFFELEEAARAKPEQRIGDAVRPGEDPKWPRVAELGEQLLLRSKDLRIAVLLTRALTHTEGIPGDRK